MKQADREKLDRILPLVRERVRTLAEIPPMIDFFFRDPTHLTAPDLSQKRYDVRQVAGALRAVNEVLHDCDPWTSEAIVQVVTACAERIGWKRGDLFMAIRVAVTGRAVTPPLTESMEILGRDTCTSRIGRAVELLEGGEA